MSPLCPSYSSVSPAPRPKKRRKQKESKALSLDAFVSSIYLPYAKQYKASWDVDERNFRLHISATLGELRLDDITQRDVEIWFRGLSEKGLASTTCNRILASLKSICALALEYNLFPSGQCPCAKISPLKIHGVRERYLTDAQATQVMYELDRSDQPQAKIAKLLILTGARKSEIRKARWEHVHLEQRILTVPVSKSGKARHIPLSDEAVEVFLSIPKVEGCPWVFPGHAPGKPLSDIFLFWNKLRRLLEQAEGISRSPQFLHKIIINGRRKSLFSRRIARNAGLSVDEVDLILAQNQK